MTRKDAIEILEEVKTIDDSMFAYSHVYNDALDMAIEALKAQEAEEPNIEGNVENDGRGSWWWYICGACRQPIDKGDKFCRWCGKRVKWGG